MIRYALAPDRPRDKKTAEEHRDAWRDEHDHRAPKSLDGGIADVRSALFDSGG